jgi:NNP family nitrate/nitrite transporter-like MFS transporter
VGGIVGVLGGLGGFFFPLLFGYLLKGSGIWTTCWLVFLLLSIACLAWMHLVVQRLMARSAPHAAREIDTTPELAREMEHLAHAMEGLAERLRRPARGAA